MSIKYIFIDIASYIAIPRYQGCFVHTFTIFFWRYCYELPVYNQVICLFVSSEGKLISNLLNMRIFCCCISLYFDENNNGSGNSVLVLFYAADFSIKVCRGNLLVYWYVLLLCCVFHSLNLPKTWVYKLYPTDWIVYTQSFVFTLCFWN